MDQASVGISLISFFTMAVVGAVVGSAYLRWADKRATKAIAREVRRAGQLLEIQATITVYEMRDGVVMNRRPAYPMAVIGGMVSSIHQMLEPLWQLFEDVIDSFGPMCQTILDAAGPEGFLEAVGEEGVSIFGDDAARGIIKGPW